MGKARRSNAAPKEINAKAKQTKSTRPANAINAGGKPYQTEFKPKSNRNQTEAKLSDRNQTEIRV
jgi:hypothetical protein